MYSVHCTVYNVKKQKDQRKARGNVRERLEAMLEKDYWQCQRKTRERLEKGWRKARERLEKG